MTDQNAQHHGGCYCGAVKVSVSEPPMAAGFCHCLSCRKWHSAPINAWAIWPADKVTVSGDVVSAEVDAGSQRLSCAKCGGAIGNGKPTLDMTVIYTMSLAGSDFKFEPTMHVWYAERVMDVNDGLPKLRRTFPEGFGGTGELMEEAASTGWCA